MLDFVSTADPIALRSLLAPDTVEDLADELASNLMGALETAEHMVPLIDPGPGPSTASGGSDVDDLASVEIFDPQTNSWTAGVALFLH